VRAVSQGEQIGRIFAYRSIAFFLGSQKFWTTFIQGKS
jgi:hypothetical protein